MQDRTASDHGHWAQALIQGRHSTSPRRLCAPGPDAAQQQLILAAAAAGPDHGRILPWRLIEVPLAQRARLGAAFAAALLERDPQASAEQLAQAADKAQRAPWLLLALLRLNAAGAETPQIPDHERLLSAGAALQNMLLQASALGLGSSLTSGQALQSAPLRHLFGLADDEMALCFVNIGHVVQPRAVRERPSVDAYFSRLAPPPPVKASAT